MGGDGSSGAGDARGLWTLARDDVADLDKGGSGETSLEGLWRVAAGRLWNGSPGVTTSEPFLAVSGTSTSEEQAGSSDQRRHMGVGRDEAQHWWRVRPQ